MCRIYGVKQETSVQLRIRERSCGTCTKCCDGYLSGEVQGISFFPGKPCHFVDVNSGCSIYEDRPENPCKSFKCQWLVDPNFPEWAKPNLINAIFNAHHIGEHFYYSLMEAGEKLDAKILSWAITYMTINKFNFSWSYEGIFSAIGSEEFMKMYYQQEK